MEIIEIILIRVFLENKSFARTWQEEKVLTYLILAILLHFLIFILSTNEILIEFIRALQFYSYSVRSA